ncbi:MAG: hypothetical protein LW720_04190 [Pirellula sp.]|nr:hypothetical protein [Pirellula sp.]
MRNYISPVSASPGLSQPKDYDPLNWNQKKLAAAMAADRDPGKNDGAGGSGYGFFVIAVKRSGKFGFYVTGFIQIKGIGEKATRAFTSCIVAF